MSTKLFWYAGEVILHIVKGETCSIHKQTVINFKKDVGDSARVQEWNKRCNATHLWGKVQNGTLTARDMLECYIPTCDTEIYSSRQSFKLSDPSDLWGEVRKYYWCSGPTGMYIDGTLSNDRDSMNCSKYTSLLVTYSWHYSIFYSLFFKNKFHNWFL